MANNNMVKLIRTVNNKVEIEEFPEDTAKQAIKYGTWAKYQGETAQEEEWDGEIEKEAPKKRGRQPKS